MIARRTTLVLPQPLMERLRAHLFPGDGLEAAGLLLCGSTAGRRQKLTARDWLPVPHEACHRHADYITWPGEYVEKAIAMAEATGLAIIAVHSHPGGLFAFSDADDKSDRVLMPALYHGTDRNCGSAIVTPDGAVRARLYSGGVHMQPIDLVSCAGDDLSYCWDGDAPRPRPMAFTSGMTAWLKQLSVCVIGVSGTGSIVAEQLARLGFGEIILIDFDKIEWRNLNRILNSTEADAVSETLKVEMFAAAIRSYRSDCEVIGIAKNISMRDAVLGACEADLLVSCVDTAEGRHIADRLAAHFLMPLLDVGVSIPTRVAGHERVIVEVCGRIDYVQPGGSTLLDRGVYDAASLEAEYLARAAPDAHRRKLEEGYLRGATEEAPSVIALNMRAASACVLEFIARAFPFRHEPNEGFARTIFTLSDGCEDRFAESSFPRKEAFSLGGGTQEPLLGLPALAARRQG
ncbi:ThiF family adenylyltransferase [Bradyrhizobium aeschynomenes]|uniref:ThiF family adenylyltransferase n=1 Tax=Bradyrhizobium aeschynomenes TaxID=2734909 RepID=UPI00322208D9